MIGSVEINSEKGIEGLFSFCTTIENSLETKPNTNKSERPVTIARGKIPNRDFFLFIERISKSLISKFMVLLYI